MKDRLILAEPSMDLEEPFHRLTEDYRKAGEQLYTNLSDIHGMAFDLYIKNLQRECLEHKGSSGAAPCSVFWMISPKNDICGISRLWHYLTPDTEIEGGQVGFDVPPSLRRRGLGTMLLKLTAERALELKIQRLLAACDWDNFGAIGVIKNNGGKLENTVVSKSTGKKIMRFWIELS